MKFVPLAEATGVIQSTSFIQIHNPRPVLFKRPLSHEQTQMITRRDRVADIFRLRSYQPLHCKQLFRSNHFVGAASKKIHWKPQPREVDLCVTTSTNHL